MIRIVVDRVFSGDLHYQEMFGLSTDTKPTEGLITGSKFTETDTGDVYLLEEGENAEWHKSAEGPGSGGGGGSGLTELVLDMTVEQQSAWIDTGKLVFTESQLAQISYENPVDRLVLHGEAGSTVMNIYMYLQGKENLYSKYLKYGSTGGQSDIAGEDDFAALCVTSFCQIKFDNSGESAIEGWYAQSILPQIQDTPNDNGTYVLKCTVSNYMPTLFWEAES